MKDRFFKKINMQIVNFVVVMIMAIVTAFSLLSIKQYAAFIFVLIFFLLFSFVNVLVYVINRRINIKTVKNLSYYLYGDDTKIGAGAITQFKLPIAFLSTKGKLIWANEELNEVFGNKNQLKNSLYEFFSIKLRPQIEYNNKDKIFNETIGDRSFIVYYSIVNAEADDKPDFIVMLYFVETTEFTDLQKLYKKRRTAIGEIIVDSYEEIYQQSGEAVMNQITVELSKIFDKWLQGKKALLKKRTRDKYLLVIEDDELHQLEKDKFSILNEAKKISVGNNIPVTLSIGIASYNDSVEENFNAAASALELALDRGGDQAIVRIDNKDTFYGASDIELESLNKVKSRLTADILKKEILASKKVFIVGHRFPDMDALGSALAIYRACTELGVPSNIILNSSNPTIDIMMENLKKSGEYEDVFISTSRALTETNMTNLLLVVVDVFSQEKTECPEIFEHIDRVVVIDHHRKNADHIKGAIIDYSESYASSTSELIIELLNYMIQNINLHPLEVEAMYAGILIDTKYFTFKTGTRTFDAAAFLRKQGVDTVSVRKYCQPDMQTFIDISRVTSNARIVLNKISISRVPLSMDNKDMVASIASDQMLDVLGVEASFVLAEDNGNVVKIKGRSKGKINVQIILEKMNHGGGHFTAAATFMKDITIEDAEAELILNIADYLKQ